VTPDILGQSHAFTFDGHDINVALPGAKRLAGFKTGEGEFVDDRLSVRGWREQDEQREPLAVEVHDVDAVVVIPGSTTVPNEVLTRPINDYELFAEQQQEYLNKLTSNYGKIARQAFDYWIRLVRWKADSWRLGLPEISGEETGWGTYLQEKNSRKDLWAGPLRIVSVLPIASVTRAVWDEPAAALDSGVSPPIFNDLLYDALIHLDRKDLQRAIVDAAMAAEIYMKRIVHEGLPTALQRIAVMLASCLALLTYHLIVGAFSLLFGTRVRLLMHP